MVPRLIITRQKWKAGEPRYTDSLDLPVSKVHLFHCNISTIKDIASGLEAVKKMQYIDTYACQFPDIAFNFLIGDDGTIYEGRGWLVANENLDPDETGRYKPESLDIGLLTDFTEEQPPPQIADAIDDIIEYGIKQKYITQPFTTKMIYMGY